MASPISSGPPRPPSVTGERAPRLRFPTKVRRIRLLYADGEWRTLANFVIDRKTLPQGHAVQKEGGRGFWYELRDRRGKLLYANKAANPFEPSLELFEPGGRVHRVELKRETVFVELLVPDLAAGTELRVFSDISPEGKRLNRAEPIRVMKMTDYRKGGRGKRGGDGDK